MWRLVVRRVLVRRWWVVVETAVALVVFVVVMACVVVPLITEVLKDEVVDSEVEDVAGAAVVVVSISVMVVVVVVGIGITIGGVSASTVMLRGLVPLVELDRSAYTSSSASINAWLPRVSLTVEVLSVLVIMYTTTSIEVSSCAIVVVELNTAVVVEVKDAVVVVEGGEVVVVVSVSVPFPVKFPGMSVVAGVLVVPRGMPVVGMGMVVNWD